MVFDTLENAPQYYGLGARFQQAFTWLRETDLSALQSQKRIDIDGDNLYATCFEVDTLPQADSRLEGHRNYADIQILLEGRERVGYALAGTATASTDYTPDIQFFTGPFDTLTLHAGCFYIVWPQDLHAPRIADGSAAHVRRLVIKVKL